MSKVVLPTTTEEWQRDCQIMYNQGRKDAVNFFKFLIIRDDEDYDKPTISMKFLNDYIEQMIIDGFGAVKGAGTSKCDDCNLGCIDFESCFQCKGNTCEKEVRADERAKVLEEVKMKFLKIAKELAEKGQILSDEQYYSLMDVVNLD